jgi:hypothetical protein
MKTTLSGLALLLLVAAGYYLYVHRPSLPLEQGTAASVAAQLTAKYGKQATVTIERDSGTFAMGSVRFAGEQGGGLWFAAKTADGWQLAYDGNGIIPCDAANAYNFPTDMVPQCIDTAQRNALVERNATGTPVQASFSADGNLARNNPGQTPNVWYLVYEGPGAPALTVALDLSVLETSSTALAVGDRVHVEGTRKDDVVMVNAITPL